jgi:hypothetical protein
MQQERERKEGCGGERRGKEGKRRRRKMMVEKERVEKENC